MPYAKVVLGLPVKDPFDYFIPPNLSPKADVGKRVVVPFRDKKLVGYIIALTPRTRIKKIKSIYDIIDDQQLLDQELLTLTEEVSNYYFCSWGEVIEAALPSRLKKASKAPLLKNRLFGYRRRKRSQRLLIHDLSGIKRWEIYYKAIERALGNQENIIFLSPQIDLAKDYYERIKARFDKGVVLLHSRQTSKVHFDAWLKIRNGEARVVVGSRQAIFAPLNNLGLIIIDEENNNSYKQDQSPHYHAGEVAFLRSKISGADLLISGVNPRLESFYLARTGKIGYQLIKPEIRPEVKIVDMRKETYSKVTKTIFSFPFKDTLAQALSEKKKILIFLNRRGFATFAYCPSCGKVLRCQRCNVNLIFLYRENKLVCGYCSYNIEPVEICPDCNTSYIRYAGVGIEKVESELSRLFPQAKILKVVGSKSLKDKAADILISTSSIFKIRPQGIEFIGVVSLDNSLNRIDFRSAESTFSILLNLLSLGSKKMIIQSNLPQHYVFQAISKDDIDLFYSTELEFRKELKLPPFSHIAFIKLRGKNSDKVREKSYRLFEQIKKSNQDRQIKIISCFPATPKKLRGNFYWQILIRAKDPIKMSRFFKNNLRIISHSDIIVTVDIDPV